MPYGTLPYVWDRSPSAWLASRQAGDGAHRDIERGKLGPDRIGSEMLASTASHVRGRHARVSEQQGGAVCILVAAYFAYGVTSYVGEVCL